MTKLEELKAAWDAVDAACDAACDDALAAVYAVYAPDYAAARDAYEAELKKTQEEKQDD
jgi:hypothetical protein